MCLSDDQATASSPTETITLVARWDGSRFDSLRMRLSWCVACRHAILIPRHLAAESRGTCTVCWLRRIAPDVLDGERP